jgi:hypothetical protein
MSVDLHRIGTGISSGSSRNGFGNIVSFPSVPAGFPPYGTLISTGTEPVTLNFTYAEAPNTTGSFIWGSFPYYTRADGAGGTYLDFSTGYSLGTETATFNQVVDDAEGQINTRIIYKGGFGFTDPLAGTFSECFRLDYATGNTGNGYVTVDINGTSYTTGTYNTVERGNGFCGVTNEYTYDYSSYPYGTFLVTVYDDGIGYYYDYYCDGAGGVYSVQQ